MLHNMHLIATCILPEDFRERNQPEGTHSRLASSCHIFNLSHRRDDLGPFATGIDYCEIDSFIHQQQLCFAPSCCEQQWQNYSLFCRDLTPLS